MKNTQIQRTNTGKPPKGTWEYDESSKNIKIRIYKKCTEIITSKNVDSDDVWTMKDRNQELEASHKLTAYLTTNSNKDNAISGINLKKEEISELLQDDDNKKKSERKKYRKIPKTAKWQIYREIIKTKIYDAMGQLSRHVFQR